MAAGDSGCEAYSAIAWGVGLSYERSDIAGSESFHSLEGASLPWHERPCFQETMGYRKFRLI